MPMKNKLWFISALLLVLVLVAVFLILYSCNRENKLEEQKEVQVNATVTKEEEETAPAEEKETEPAKQGVKFERKDAFEKLVEDNPLDRDYETENHATTLPELRLHQQKFADLWLDELHFSCEYYASFLNAVDREKFLYYEEKWEKALLDEFKFVTSIYSGSAYDLSPGGIYLLERDIDYLQTLRERTLYVKYLQYTFETADGQRDAKVVFLYGSPTPPVIVNKNEPIENDKNEENPSPNGAAASEEEKNEESTEKDAKSEAKNTIIKDQEDPSIKDVKVESGNIGENGCGVVAIHNVKVIKGVGSTLSETIADIQSQNGFIIDGYLGVNPFIIDNVLKQDGIRCTSVKVKDLSTPGLYLIAFWNNPLNLGEGAHYVVLQVDENSFEVINGDQNGPEWYVDKYIYGYRIN